MQQVLNLLYLHKMLKGECMTEPPPQPQNERGKAKVKRKKKREELPNIWEKYSSIIFWALHRKMGPVVWSCCASQAMDVSYDNLDILILLILLRLTYESTSSSVHCACFSYVLLIKFAKFLCSIIQNLFFFGNIFATPWFWQIFYCSSDIFIWYCLWNDPSRFFFVVAGAATLSCGSGTSYFMTVRCANPIMIMRIISAVSWLLF